MSSLLRPEKILVLTFLALLGAPAIIQSAIEWRRDRSVQALAVFEQRPTATQLRAYEQDLADASRIGQQLRPAVQYAHFTWLDDGGEKALVGRDGWLFYTPSFRYMTERPAATRPDPSDSPLAAITDFRDQLAARGIQLLVIVAPSKECIYPDKSSSRAERLEVLVSPPTRRLLDDLTQAGVEVVDLYAAYRVAKQNLLSPDAAPFYSPPGQSLVPGGRPIRRALRRPPNSRPRLAAAARSTRKRRGRSARNGDLIQMLQVPAIASHSLPEEVVCRQVVRAGTQQPYQDEPDAEVLVMGDSFLRIYEQDEPASPGSSRTWPANCIRA